ncbi:MAG: hypothetical protein OEY56_04300 [Cyclobacteriaceae bacterium]|nr:hypothetical protein [Cyclobacteriaceae bacterium]
MKTRAPILLFVYNRPVHTRRTLESLSRNAGADQSDLFIFSDGPKSPEEEATIGAVRKIISEKYPFRSITIQEEPVNKGLARSVIDGITQIIKREGKAIVLEDDIMTSPHFLSFINAALDAHAANKSVFSVTGYCYPFTLPPDYTADTYLAYRSCSWGWATWSDRWELADWELRDFDTFSKDKGMQQGFNRAGADLSYMLKSYHQKRIDSWAIRWAYTHFLHQGLCLYPVRPMVSNTGMDGSGTHYVKKNPLLETAIEPGFEPKMVETLPALSAGINKNIYQLLDPGWLKKLFYRYKYDLRPAIRSFFHI